MKSTRSQAAMEFLMTYGWAILVVLVAISAMSYFGVLSPDIFTKDVCTLPMGLSCLDSAMDGAGNLYLSVKANTLGPIEGFSVVMYGSTYVLVNAWDEKGNPLDTEQDQSPMGSCDDQLLSLYRKRINNVISGQVMKLHLVKCSDTGGTEKGKIDIEYKLKESGLVHKESGSLTSRVLKKGDVSAQEASSNILKEPECMGGNSNGECESFDSCKCPDCFGQYGSCSWPKVCDPSGSGACISTACQNDGYCNIYYENCGCQDCEGSYDYCYNSLGVTGYACQGGNCMQSDCNHDGICDSWIGENCMCDDCQNIFFSNLCPEQDQVCDSNGVCMTSHCNNNGVCDSFNFEGMPFGEDCSCSDCFGRYEPCTEDNGKVSVPKICQSGACVDTVCNQNGMCEYWFNEDCSCSDCFNGNQDGTFCELGQMCASDGTNSCVPGQCNNDGVCDISFEECSCPDCFDTVNTYNCGYPSNGQVNKYCIMGVCIDQCGNGKCDATEDCNTCPADCMESGEICCNVQGTYTSYQGSCCTNQDCSGELSFCDWSTHTCQTTSCSGCSDFKGKHIVDTFSQYYFTNNGESATLTEYSNKNYKACWLSGDIAGSKSTITSCGPHQCNFNPVVGGLSKNNLHWAVNIYGTCS